jgi:polyisoprenoid-binding protein YceI
MHRHRIVPKALIAASLAALTTLTAGTVASVPARAATETFAIDPAHSGVGFRITHFFSKVPGSFKKYEGTIVLDRKDLTTGSVNVTIDATSIDTGVADRDNHLRSPDFFDVAKYPTITFKSTRVKPLGPNKAQVEGNLTIRGTTKPVVLEVDVLGFGPGFGGGLIGGFEARTRINRQDFGVAWNKVLEGGGAVLGNDVDIAINVEAGRQEPKPAEGETKKKGR